MTRLGSGDINLPFEPSSGELPMEDMRLSGGMVVMAGVVPVPEAGPKPALIFRFARPDGTFMPPIALVMEPDEVTATIALVEQAARAAVKAAAA